MSLSANRLIRVSLTINPLAAASRGFGSLLIIGDSDVIGTDERIRSYTDINSVAQDFGTDSEEYKAAALYYAQEPAPVNLMIGRWNKTAASAELKGGILTAVEQGIDSWAAIKNGAFKYRVNDKEVSVEGLDFTGQTNLSGVTSVINAACAQAGNDIKFSFDGNRFIVTSTQKGSDQTLGYITDTAPQINIHDLLGLNSGNAQKVDGTDLVPGKDMVPAKSGRLVGTDIAAQLGALKAVTDGSFKVSVDNEQLSLEGLNFSTASDFDDVCDAVTLKLGGKATAVYETDHITITSATTGASSTVTGAAAGEITHPEVPATPAVLTGTDVSDAIDTLKTVTDGSFKITINSSELSISGLNFSGTATGSDMADLITAKLSGTSVAKYEGGKFIITTDDTGSDATIMQAVAGEQTTPPKEATAGKFTGGTVSDESGSLTTLQAITSGTLTLDIDGGGATETGEINLSGSSSLSDAATKIQAVISGATITYDEDADKFVITSSTKGAASSVAVTAGSEDTLFNALVFNSGSAVQGTAAVAGTDVNLHTKLGLASGSAVNGTDRVPGTDNTLHEKLGLAAGASYAGAEEVPAVPGKPATAGKLISGKRADLNRIKSIGDGNMRIAVDNGLSQELKDLDFTKISTLEDVAQVISAGGLRGARIIVDGDNLVITSETTGKSSTVSYAEGTTLNEVEIGSKLKLTKETGLKPIAGADAESPLQAVQILSDKSAAWYGCTFAAVDMPTDSQLIDVAKFIEAQTDTTRIFGITATDTRVLDAAYTEDIASKCHDLKLNRTVIQYSGNPYAVCSFLGRAFTVNFSGNMTTITMMYKQEPAVEAEDLTETQAKTLENKRCNVFVKYNNGTSIIQNGVMCGDYWFDERHGSDWLRDYIQTNVWNAVYTSATKIGQDDTGINTIVSVINNSLEQARQNGFIGAGVWNGDGFGQLSRGQYMPSGYYVYAPPMSTQTQADRDARISVPIQIAAKLLGAIHSFDINITLNR